MFKVATRGLFARKLRLALTVLAVVLGTTLIAGTYVFTDSINSAFDTIFTVSNRGTDAAITPHKTIDTTNNGGTPPTVSASVLDKVRQDPNVANAEGSIFDSGTILGKNGKRIGKGGAPNFLASVADVPRFQGFTLKTGRRPQNADEAAIDAATADKQGWKVGDKVCAVATSQRKCYTLVGTTQIAGLSSFGGAAVLDLVLPEAQRMLGKGTGFDEIQVAGKPGVKPQQLKVALQRSLGPGVDVRTGQEQAAKESKDIRNNLGFLKTFLFAFAFVALFVGAFLIFNTFSITVAQRMREFALLRTLGASRRQIWRAVISEGLLLGCVGGVVGFALGIGTAALLRALFKLVGADLPSKGVVIEARTVIVTVIVGTIVSLIASLSPAIRAMRVPAVEALREGAVPVARGSGRRMLIAASLLLAIVGGNQSVSSIDPETFLGLYKLDMKKGGEAAVSNLGPDQVIVKKGYADSHDTKIGDTLQLTTPIGKHIAPKVTGIAEDKGGLLANLTVTNDVAQTAFGEPKDAFGLVGVDRGANAAAIKKQISGLLDRQYPEAEVLTNKEFKDRIAGQVNQLLGLIYALLALAIIVSLFGIVNTLVLSISERTRELGLLRAVGTSRAQVKRVVRYEAVITLLIAGMVAGVMAAVLPARRAARLDVLDALAYE